MRGPCAPHDPPALIIVPVVSQAQQRFDVLGYGNISLRHADGTKGWPDGGEFDAIVVSAGGSQIPPALKFQLKIGGWLVIPVDHVREHPG